jgi:hypothetical protein
MVYLGRRELLLTKVCLTVLTTRFEPYMLALSG